jgi:hypothetical protein
MNLGVMCIVMATSVGFAGLSGGAAAAAATVHKVCRSVAVVKIIHFTYNDKGAHKLVHGTKREIIHRRICKVTVRRPTPTTTPVVPVLATTGTVVLSTTPPTPTPVTTTTVPTSTTMPTTTTAPTTTVPPASTTVTTTTSAPPVTTTVPAPPSTTTTIPAPASTTTTVPAGPPVQYTATQTFTGPSVTYPSVVLVTSSTNALLCMYVDDGAEGTFYTAHCSHGGDSVSCGIPSCTPVLGDTGLTPGELQVGGLGDLFMTSSAIVDGNLVWYYTLAAS